MPVSTRSQIATGQDEASTIRRARPRPGEVAQVVAPLLRNPHHGLKEKMKTLTLLYERQQQESAARFSTHPSVDLLGSQKKEEKQQPTNQEGGKAIIRETENQLPVQALPVLASETKEDKEKENVMTSTTFNWILHDFLSRSGDMCERKKKKMGRGRWTVT